MYHAWVRSNPILSTSFPEIHISHDHRTHSDPSQDSSAEGQMNRSRREQDPGQRISTFAAL